MIGVEYNDLSPVISRAERAHRHRRYDDTETLQNAVEKGTMLFFSDRTVFCDLEPEEKTGPRRIAVAFVGCRAGCDLFAKPRTLG